jgi:hypothetical protein
MVVKKESLVIPCLCLTSHLHLATLVLCDSYRFDIEASSSADCIFIVPNCPPNSNPDDAASCPQILYLPSLLSTDIAIHNTANGTTLFTP